MRGKIIIALTVMLLLVGCDALTVERTTIIDYRYSSEWVEYYVVEGKQNSIYHPEKWQLEYEITYADGHVERRWKDVTRFEYQKAKEELGEVEP